MCTCHVLTGKRSILHQTPQFPFPICHKQVDRPPSLTYARHCSLESCSREERKRRRGRRRRRRRGGASRCKSVELKELKDASLLVSFDPRHPLDQKGEVKKKKERKKRENGPVPKGECGMSKFLLLGSVRESREEQFALRAHNDGDY